MIGIYQFLVRTFWSQIEKHLQDRLADGKEDPKRFDERFGHSKRRRPDTGLVWIHGASVGEAVSALPLIDAILNARDDVRVLVTTGTVTSAQLLAKRLPDRAIHQYVPVDHPDCVQRFLDRWQPNLAIWMESEFWPNLMLQSLAERVPMILMNGRVSERSFRRWSWVRGTISRLLDCFDLTLGQTRMDAERLQALGARNVISVGNLKFAAPPLPVSTGDLNSLKTRITDRPVWIAASTHPGEEALAARVHRRLARELPDLLTIIVPRHPNRGDAIAADLRKARFNVAQRSRAQALAKGTEIYLADTMGELGLFYRLDAPVFIGKSLAPEGAGGGQNPIEPARLGAPILFGPKMTNFAEIATRMLESEAGVAVKDEASLAAAIGVLTVESDRAAKLASNAKAFAESEAGVLDRVMVELEPFLNRIPRPPEPEPAPEDQPQKPDGDPKA
ncbi:MAG: 3-deoxy-D-manno-octulosonic acid transferase [Magnetovibrionaceae bacterium]